MTTTSADTNRLQTFIDSASAARSTLSEREQNVQAVYRSFLNSGSVSGGSLGSLPRLRPYLDVMEANERFIYVIRQALIDADGYSSGVIVLADSLIAERLGSAGLTQAPLPIYVADPSLLGLPATSGFVDDPVCTANGNFVQVETDLTFPARSSVLDVCRTYNSLAAGRDSSFGLGWTSILDVRLRVTDAGVTVLLVDGGEAFFCRNADGDFVSSSRPQLRLSRSTDNGWVFSDKPGSTWHFSPEGLLVARSVENRRVNFDHNANEQVFRCSEPVSERSLDFVWDETGHVTLITSSDGRGIHYDYELGHLVSVDRPIGRVRYEIDNGRIASITDADGVVIVANVYDDFGRVVRQQSSFGRTSLYTYGETGVTVATDTEGAARNAFVHDAKGNLISMIDAKGYALRLTYDEAGNLISWTDRRGANWNLVWDEVARKPIARNGPLEWNEQWTWDDTGRLISHKTPWGETALSYAADQLSPSRVAEPGGAITHMNINGDDLPTSITDADGITIELQWDGDGQLVSSVDGLGHCFALAYDPAGLLASWRSPSSLTIHYETDVAGRVITARGPRAQWKYDWSQAGRAVGGIDPISGVWSATYGSSGALAQIIDAEGGATGFSYDAFGNIAEVVGPDGRSYKQHHDGLSQLIIATDPSGAQWSYEYDPEGNLLAVTEPTGSTRRRTVDALGRTITETDAEGRCFTREWDKAGRVVAIAGPGDDRWSYCYDESGRVVEVGDNTGYFERKTYSAAGRVTRRECSTGLELSYTYDRAGRVVTTTDRDGTLSIVYDVDGRVVEVCDEQDKLCQLNYDEAGQLVSVRDKQGRTRLVDFGQSSVSVESPGTNPSSWTARGQLASVADANGGVTNFSYDQAGRLVSTVDPMAGLTSFAYDNAGRLGSITNALGSTATIIRDAGGVSTGAQYGNGSGMQSWSDKTGRVVGLSALNSQVPEIPLSYDSNGNLEGMPARGERRMVPRRQEPAGFTFDEAGRITGSPDGSIYRHDNAGQLVEWLTATGKAVRYIYDLGGRLISEDCLDEHIDYHYNPLGQLIGKEDPNNFTRYSYDIVGRRMGEQSNDGSKVTYEWDVADRLVRIENCSAAGETTQRVLHYNNLGLLNAIDDVEVNWDLTTGWPQVIALGDSSAAVSIEDIDPWGANDNRGVRLNRRGELCIDNLVWLHARVYDPTTRAFLSLDPLPNPPGMPCSANPYHYAWNDPVTNIDPTGLRPLTQADFNARTDQESLGIFDKAWNQIKDATWAASGDILTVVPGVGLIFQASHLSSSLLISAGVGKNNPALQGLQEVSNFGTNFSHGVAASIGKLITGTASSAYDFAKLGYSVSVLHAVIDPHAWWHDVKTTANDFNYITSHPQLLVKAFVKDTVAWDTFAKGNYAEGLGESITNIAMFFTGAGELKGITSSARTVSDVAEVTRMAQDRRLFEAYKDVLRANMEKPQVENQKLADIMDYAYRDGATIGSGSTADAVRHEKLTGEFIQGKLHAKKAVDIVRRLEKWLRTNPTASSGDRAAAENVLRDTQNALEGHEANFDN